MVTQGEVAGADHNHLVPEHHSEVERQLVGLGRAFTPWELPAGLRWRYFGYAEHLINLCFSVSLGQGGGEKYSLICKWEFGVG